MKHNLFKACRKAYFIIHTQSQVSSCCKSLFDASRRAGRKYLPFTKDKWENHNRTPGWRPLDTLRKYLLRLQDSWCPRHSRPQRAGCSVSRHYAEKGLRSPIYEDPPSPELHSSIHQKDWGKKRYLLEKAFKQNPHHEKKRSIQTQCSIKLVEKPKRKSLPWLQLVNKQDAEQSRWDLLWVHVCLYLSTNTLHIEIISKHKHSVWGWNNPNLDLTVHVFKNNHLHYLLQLHVKVQLSQNRKFI